MVMPFPATGSDMGERHEQNLPRRRRVGDRGDPHPTNVYWSYGAHNLSNQHGDHYVFNNQYGGASMSLCTGYNGVGCGARGAGNRELQPDAVQLGDPQPVAHSLPRDCTRNRERRWRTLASKASPTPGPWTDRPAHDVFRGHALRGASGDVVLVREPRCMRPSRGTRLESAGQAMALRGVAPAVAR